MQEQQPPQVYPINKQTLTLSQLTQAISKWVTDLSPSKLSCEFKYSLNPLKTIPKQFLIKTIFYACLKQLKTFINATSQQKHENFVGLAVNIKEFYYMNSIEGIWKDTFHFEFSLIYLIKIIARFCSEHFKEVEIDFRFESEIFIVLVHVMLGNNMGIKSYKLLEKKYTGKKNLKLLQLSKKKKFLSIKDTSKSDEFKEQTYDKDDSLGKDSVQGFKNDLMMSLYVQPLPKLEIKRKSLNYFLRPTNLEEKYSIRNKLDSIQQRLKKHVVKSTQLSTSLKTEIKKHQSFVAMHNKPFNINHRLPFSIGKCVFNKKIKKMDEREIPINHSCEHEKQYTKVEYKQWLKIIGNMKDVIHEDDSKVEFGMMRSLQDRKTNSEEIIVQNYQSIKENITQKSIACERPCRIEEKTATRLIQEPLEQRQPRTSEYRTPSPDEKDSTILLPSAKELKLMKRQFEDNCGVRDRKIQHSIFMLPSIKNNTHYSSSFKL